jgi:hypothetical protein
MAMRGVPKLMGGERAAGPAAAREPSGDDRERAVLRKALWFVFALSFVALFGPFYASSGGRGPDWETFRLAVVTLTVSLAGLAASLPHGRP